jgi:hypothetical protein
MTLPCPPPLRKLVYAENKPLMMIVDTGAGASVISMKTYRAKFKDIPLNRLSSDEFVTITGERCAAIGVIDVQVRDGHLQRRMPLVVLAKDCPNLLGRNWMNTRIDSNLAIRGGM